MARIRSVHPGFFTDEAWVSVSAFARLLGIGLWTESDDQGVFEWKPVTLRMRLFPADNVDVGALLAELVAADLVRQYTHEGKQYGICRNFTRYQRPKKPKSVHFMPPEFGTYAGSNKPSGELDDDETPPVPPKEELAPQMEDGGWRGGDITEPIGSGGKPPADPVKTLFDSGVQILTAAGQSERLARSIVGQLRSARGDGDAAKIIADAARATEPVTFIEGAIHKRIANGLGHKRKPGAVL